tara:strand:+ start:9928 stop:10188 length:261 start_codon:yes stop_codon:yes gene_type:complete
VVAVLAGLPTGASRGVGKDAENDSSAQRNTEKVDPSTNRLIVRDAILLRLMMRPLVVMGRRDAKPGVEKQREGALGASEERRGRAG